MGLTFTCDFPGRCSIATIMMRIKNGIRRPYSSQMSINLMWEVVGSCAAIEAVSVYMTSMEVIARGRELS